MGGRPTPFVFQAGEAVALEGGDDGPDMLVREIEDGGDAALLPALVIHPYHGPAGAVGVIELMETRERQGELHGEGVPLQEGPHGVMIGVIAELTSHDAHQLAIVDGRIELLGVQEIAGDTLWEGVRLAPRVTGPLIGQTEHPFHQEAARLVPDSAAVEPCLDRALGQRLGVEHDFADDLVVVLDGIGEQELELLEIVRLWRRHATPSTMTRRAFLRCAKCITHPALTVGTRFLPTQFVCHVAGSTWDAQDGRRIISASRPSRSWPGSSGAGSGVSSPNVPSTSTLNSSLLSVPWTVGLRVLVIGSGGMRGQSPAAYAAARTGFSDQTICRPWSGNGCLSLSAIAQ